MTTTPPGFTTVRELGEERLGPSALCRAGDGVEFVVTSLGAPDVAARLEFESELAAAAAAFDHPCAVPSTLVADGGSLWLTEPNLPGAVETAPVAADAATAGGVRLTAVLAQGHAAGMLHGDVRPANVLRDADGRWCLAGAGVAHAVARIGVAAPPDPLFAAPEYFSGEQPGAASDVYALGATLYAALVGAAPHAEAARDGVGALYAARLGPPPAPPVAVPAALAALITRMLAPDPAERPALAEVDQVLRGLAPAGAALPPPIRLREDPPPPRPAVRLVVTEPGVVAAASKRRTVVAAAAIGAVFLAGAGAVAATSGGDDDGVQLAAGSEPTASPTPNGGSPSPAGTPSETAASKKPREATAPKPAKETTSTGLSTDYLKPVDVALNPVFSDGKWHLQVTYRMRAMIDSIVGWKVSAYNPTTGEPVASGTYVPTDRRISSWGYDFQPGVPLTSCVDVATLVGIAETPYASEKKCLSASEVRRKQATNKPAPVAPATTPKATKP